MMKPGDFVTLSSIGTPDECDDVDDNVWFRVEADNGETLRIKPVYVGKIPRVYNLIHPRSLPKSRLRKATEAELSQLTMALWQP